MQLTRQQFDIAVPGGYTLALVAAVMLASAALVPVAVIGGLVVGLAYAFRDAGHER